MSVVSLGSMGGEVLGAMGQRQRLKSGTDMDMDRRQSAGYEYLCHLQEAKQWMEECIMEELPATTELEEGLRNGVFLAKLAHFMAPAVVPIRKIFDADQSRWRRCGLHFKHTDNIVHFMNAAKHIGLPPIFLPETTDIYDCKNMPRTIFCIHALSLFMFKLGSAPQIKDLYGRVAFTPADITLMDAELEERGVDMPQFRGLGNLLADQGGGDAMSRAEAINAIINCVAGGEERKLIVCLTNPDAGLREAKAGHVREYLMVLQEARKEKHTGVLSQAEIQGHITRVNLLLGLERVAAAVREENSIALESGLKEVGVSGVRSASMDLYLTHLCDTVHSLGHGDLLRREMIQSAVNAANDLWREQQGVEDAVTNLNKALSYGTPKETLAALRQPALRLGPLSSSAADLFHTELRYIQQELKAPLTYEGISEPVAFLGRVAAVGEAAMSGDQGGIWRRLAHPELALMDLDSGAASRYSSELISFARLQNRMLTHGELQEVVDRVNTGLNKDLSRLGAVQAVNLALERGEGLWQALKNAGATAGVDQGDEFRLMMELKDIQTNRSQMETRGEEVWWEDILEGVESVKEAVSEVESMAGVLRGLNSAIAAGDRLGVWNYVNNNGEILGLSTRPRQDLAAEYLSSLQRLAVKKSKGHSWVEVDLRDGTSAWVEIDGGRRSWQRPNASLGRCHVLGVPEVRDCVEKVTGGKEEAAMVQTFVKLQARCRGWLVRSKVFAMLDWYYRHEASLVKVQAVWRGRQVRRRLAKLLEERRTEARKYRRNRELSAVVLQRWWRAILKRKRNQVGIRQGDSALACQAPTLSTVVEHLHLLQVRDIDFSEELQISSVRGELSKLIRANEVTERKVDEMDVKIGLLIQNRISVQEVMSESSRRGVGTMRRKLPSEGAAVASHRGLKALKKESHDKLVSYQHLFHLLQTEPTYLARLMFAMPQSKTTKFLESVILTLYNFGGNVREEFLLLKLFKTALIEEVDTRVERLQDVVSGNPLVVKLVVSYNRSGRGGYGLKDLVGPLVKQVVEDPKLKINTNPVEVYKSWVNQVESETGKPAGLPYDVSQEVALAHPEVQKRLQRSITELKRITKLFLATIVQSRDKFPYGILYCSKVLYLALKDKFPEAHEKELLKVVGNLVYYRFVNPTIVAPERFDMLERKELHLTNDQRRNLGSVAKILQFAASKKGFGDESEHLMCLNPFIIECHEKFKSFFVACCQASEPEEYFGMDRYTEAVMVARPSIYISLAELTDTHQLLLDHREAVAPLVGDPLHQLLSSLGPPSLCSLLGAADADADSSVASLGKTEVCLTLSPAPGIISASTSSDSERLWVKTKQLLVAILPAVLDAAANSGAPKSLIGSLKSRTSPEEERIYCAYLDRREAASDEADSHAGLDMANVFRDEEGRLPLEDAKRLVLKNLRILELAGMTSSKDGCQSILNSLAKDIIHQRDHRVRRKAEMENAGRVRAGLESKRDYMEQQLAHYRQYVDHCLQSINKAGNNKRVHFAQHEEGAKGRKVRNKAAVKYAATKLQEKGVLLSIGDLPPNQLKNVQFIFLPQEQEGVFEVSAKFMGVDMERMEVDLQNLLKLQYEGQAVLNLFGKAKVNVNLLLHFLNAKFYGK